MTTNNTTNIFCERCSEGDLIVIHSYGEVCPILEEEILGPDTPIKIQMGNFTYCPHCGKDLLTGELHHEKT